MANPFQGLQKALFDSMRQKAVQALGDQGNLNLVSVNTGSLGNFPWFYESQGELNQNTFLYLNHRMGPDPNGSGAVASLGDFINAYIGVLQAIDFKFSSADQAKVTAANNASQNAANTLVTSYQSTYGAITAQDLSGSGLFNPTKTDYIILYAAGQKWSGNAAGLTYQQMLNAPKLSDLLPKMPPNAAPIVANISSYLSAIGNIANLLDLAAAKRGQLQKMMRNASTPTVDNGGLQTISGAGEGPVVPGWTINESEQSLNQSLGNAGSSITVSMSASQSNSSTTQVSVEGSVGFTIPIDFLEIGVSASSSYNMSEVSGNSAAYTINAVFPGPTLVTFEPTGFDIATGMGWYDADPIHEAFNNSQQDVTGYYFSSVPSYHLNKGGDFGLLNALAISQFPTITINFAQGDYSQYQSRVTENSSVDVKLFGLCKVGGVSQSMYHATSAANSSGSGFTVTLNPGPNNQLDPAGSLSNQALVLAAQVVYPGN